MTTSTAAEIVPRLEAVAWQSIEGWGAADHGPSLLAFRRSCREILETARGFVRSSRFGGTGADWEGACRQALATPIAAARSLFESSFVACRVIDPAQPEGLFTGYFEPEYPGSRHRAPGYDVPVYGRPDDLVAFDAETEARIGVRYGRLVDGKAQAYPARRDILAGALAGRGLELAWMASPIDAYFMQVQGSGRLRLPEGGIMRLAYAAKSGRPYTSIGKLLADRRIMAREAVTMDSIRAWMAADPGAAADLMAENESFVFFREVAMGDPLLGPPGAQQVGLTRRISLAVDHRYWTYGTPVWLETAVPASGGAETFRQLMIAQDTGSAIRGPLRGDIFFGSGAAAGVPAGRMQAPGRMLVLLPPALASRFGCARP